MSDTNENLPAVPLSREATTAFNWVRNYAEETGLSRQELAIKLGYDESTISKIVNLRYTGNTQTAVDRIEKFRLSLIADIESAAEFPFVETQVAKTIHSYIDLCVKWRKLGTVIAESQTGKSRAFKQYRRKGRTVVYLDLPDGGHKSKVVLDLCEAFGVSDKYNTPQREKKVRQAITRDHILLIDELQQCSARPLSGGRISGERTETVEYLRKLKDRTGCAMVFSGTTEALRMLKGDNSAGGVQGHESGHIHIQTLKRALDPLHIPNNPPKRDVDAFARTIGLDPADNKDVVHRVKNAKGETIKTYTMKALQDEQLVARGLEIWLTYLLAGAEIANGEGRSVTWADVLRAFNIFTGGAQ